MDRKKIIVAVSVLIGISVLVVVILLVRKDTESGVVVINNISSCSKSIHKDVAHDVFTKTYGLVKTANDYNQKTTAPRYEATIRKDSCDEPILHEVTNESGDTVDVKTSVVIVDIPEAKQSWTIQYDWVTKKGDASRDLGSITPQCLPDDQLIYGDFKCANIVSYMKYGTDKYDPILEYMPYDGEGFNLGYNPETRVVTASLEIPKKDLDNAELIENNKFAVSYWFEYRKLDIKNYELVFEIVSPE